MSEPRHVIPLVLCLSVKSFSEITIITAISISDEGMITSDTTIDYKVSSFQINLLFRFENKLLPNDLIIVRNHGDNDKDVGEEFGGMVDQRG